VIVDVPAAARALERGELVAYPTETVYGLGADAASPRALASLERVKGREPASGLSVLVGDVAALLALAPGLPPRARGLAERFWPGPLTLVVESAAPALDRVRTADGVGFRCSSHPTARALARAFGRPLVATSCNRTGEPPCVTAGEVARAFPGLPIAGGEPAGGGPPSTVVAVAPDGAIRVLRAGAIAPAEIEKESAR
jgi:L-threonylcarbamoyladenylate synthase